MATLAATTATAQDRPWAAIGRPATPAEVRAWDTDVRADFKGLPAGHGSVAQGQAVFEARCARCHGVFGEANDFFTPLVGGTTQADIARGRVQALAQREQPFRTMLMRLSKLSTLWDFIHRAMPWDAPKSLSVDEVYAVTAYLLSLGDIVPADFVLSERNIADVQQHLPNRDGKVTVPGLWDVHGSGDVANTACMRDCPVEGRITSSYPAAEIGSHGNLANQMRPLGPLRGIAAPATSAAPSTLGTPSTSATPSMLAASAPPR
jgi:cytochrome c